MSLSGPVSFDRLSNKVTITLSLFDQNGKKLSQDRILSYDKKTKRLLSQNALQAFDRRSDALPRRIE